MFKNVGPILGSLYFLVGSFTAFAFDIPADLRTRFLGDLEGKVKSGGLSAGMDAMDNSMDENAYLIGGGDVFQIDITNLPSKNYNPVVGSDGNLFDDELGLVPVAGLTLKEARHKIEAHVRKILRKDYEIRVVLAKAKIVNVSVTGDITIPGSQLLPGTNRIIDAIKQSNQNFLPAANKANLREVIVKNVNGKRASYDILKYLVHQDFSQNPYLYPGDQIHIMPIGAQIFVVGEVHSPALGYLPLRKQETIGEFIQSLNFTARADSNHIQLQRAGTTVMESLNLPEDSKTVLNDGDALFITSKQNFIITDTVTVTGKAARPGTYPIASGKTTVEEVILAAGGTVAGGDSENWLLIRHSKLNSLKTKESGKDLLTQASLPSPRITAQASASFVRPEMRSAVADLFLGGDFALIFPKKNEKTVLIGSDEIHIPGREQFVYLSGAVSLPGPQPYKEGATFDDYVKMAGGVTAKSDRLNAFALTVYNGLTSIKSEREIRPGDILVVPSGVEYKRLSAVYLPLIQTMATVVTTILTGFLVYNQSQ
jgi:protein involved in polysaccharide export with SLBB domain